MTPISCSAARPTLGALVDGELSGAEMLRVTGHLEHCDACSDAVEDIRSVGEVLRVNARDIPMPDMDGLADGVFTRVRAEREQSWRGTFTRAVDDWHWAIVGLGSLSATAAVALFVSAVLWFGPAPERPDSLAAVFNETAARPVFVVSTGNGNWDNVLDRAASGRGLSHQSNGQVALAAFVGPTEQELVGSLSDAVTRHGRYISLDSMPEWESVYVNALLDRISTLRASTIQVYLLARTTVSASP
jgi:anti-sigma factor RsiW